MLKGPSMGKDDFNDGSHLPFLDMMMQRIILNAQGKRIEIMNSKGMNKLFLNLQ